MRPSTLINYIKHIKVLKELLKGGTLTKTQESALKYVLRFTSVQFLFFTIIGLARTLQELYSWFNLTAQ